MPHRRLYEVLVEHDHTAAELASALAGLLLGGWLVQRGATFAAAGYRALIETTAPVGDPETVWSAVLLAHGAVGLAVLGSGGVLGRRLFALWGLLLWSFLALALYRVNSIGWGAPLFVQLALGSCWPLWRLAARRR